MAAASVAENIKAADRRCYWGDQSLLCLEVIEKAGLLRPDRATHPFKLVQSDMPVMDREETWRGLLGSTSYRCRQIRPDSTGMCKTAAPLLTVFGGPGSGKSRFLDEVASHESRTRALAIPEMPKYSNETFARDQKFATTMQNAVGITVTFGPAMEHIPTCTSDRSTEDGLALRTFYSYFVKHDQLSWQTFADMVGRYTFQMSAVLNRILIDIDKHWALENGEQRQLILCIDDVLRGVEQRTSTRSVQAEFEMFLTNQLRSHLMCIPRLHVVSAAPFYRINMASFMYSHVYSRELALPRLSASSVDNLLLQEGFIPAWNQLDAAKQAMIHRFLHDAQGNPRWLAASRDVVVAADGNFNSIEELRDKLAERPPMLELVAHLSNPRLRRSLIWAVLGNRIAKRRHDEEIRLGFMQMWADWDDCIPDIVPIVLPSMIHCLQRHHDQIPDVAARELVRLLHQFLCSFDNNDPPAADVHAKLEQQFPLFWRIRNLALVTAGLCLDGRIADLASLESERPMTHVLATGDVRGRLFKEEIVVPALMNAVESNAPDLSAGTFWSSDSHEPSDGVDAIASYQSAPGIPTISLAFQYRWPDKPDDSLSPEDVALVIVTTCKRHPCLHESIKKGTFGFVFVAHRTGKDADPYFGRRSSKWADLLPGKLEACIAQHWPEATAADRKLVEKAATNMVMLCNFDVNDIFSPTFSDAR